MALREQVKILRRGVKAWNRWRQENKSVRIDLRDAKLNSLDLQNVDLRAADLRQARLSFSRLNDANLSNANLWYAKLGGANLSNANLNEANLRGADIGVTTVSNASFRFACLDGADLIEAKFIATDFSFANLASIRALRTNFEGATLTGACIEDWNVNRETNLNNVVCEYIFLNAKKRNSQAGYSDRFPPIPATFEPGDFTRRIQNSLEAGDRAFREGFPRS